jgi:glycosyltransferase involved in cell wall biosynthesis
LQKINDSIIKNIEVIVVDDGSTDGTAEYLKKKLNTLYTEIYFHKKNLGKGAAIRTALSKISGDIVIIQDADMEYDPNDYPKLIKPIRDNLTKVVYGSRVLGKKRYPSRNIFVHRRILYNHILTIFSNIFNKQNLTDAHTCYKVFSKEILTVIKLQENRFNFCPEITTKLSLNNYQIVEVPINYKPRTYEEGKKIKFVDGLDALYTIIKYRFF